MPRPLGPALLATLTATGCYTGRSESAAETAPFTATADTGEATASGGIDPDATDISITVVDRASKPIVGARVHHLDPDDHVHLTDGSGHLVLTGFSGTRQVIQVEGDGYAPGTAVVDLVPGHSMEARVTLLRRDPADPATFKNFDAGEGVESLDFGAVQVSIPAHALVDPDDPSKIPVVGPVAISVVPIDPTTDLIASPGPLQGLDRDGRTVPLRSLFMAEISVWQGNKQLQLHGDPDLDATIRYRLPPEIAAKYAASTMVPAWYYDFDAGLWIEDIDHDDSIVDADGFWTATVSHFTPWNADVPIKELGCVLVTAKTCQNGLCVPAPYVPVTAQGSDFLITELTDETSMACLNVPANAQGKIYLGLPGDPKSDPNTAIPATSNASCGTPADCAPMLLKGGPVCTNGSTQECVYEGPPNTNGIGACQPPRRVCEGNAYGLCEDGHVPIGVDDGCGGEDIDCDGLFEPGEGCNCPATKEYVCYDHPSQEHLNAPDQCGGGEIKCKKDDPAPACTGANYPKNENPNTDADEDCDGSLGAGDGTLMSSRVYYASGEDVDKNCANQQVWDVAVDDTYVYIAGTFSNGIDLGGCALTNGDNNSEDIFLARLDKNLICDRAFHVRVGNSYSAGVRLARAPGGEIAVLGVCGKGNDAVLENGAIVPNGEIACPLAPTTMVAFFDSNFNFKSSAPLGGYDAGITDQYVDARAITYSQDMQRFLVTGGFTAATHPDPKSSKSTEDIFIAAYLTSGEPEKFYQFGSDTAAYKGFGSWATAIEAVGDKIIIAGNFKGGVFFKDEPLYTGGGGAFVARFATNDLTAPQQAIRLASTNPGLIVNDLSGADAQGRTFAVGTFVQNVIIGEVNPTINLIHSGGGDGVLLPIGPDFMPQQPIVFNGGTTSQKAHRVALNNADEPHVAGEFAGSITVQPMTVTNTDNVDSFLVKHTSKYQDPLWIWQAEADDVATLHGLAIDGKQTSYVVGKVIEKSALGLPGGCTDGFIAKISK